MSLRRCSSNVAHRRRYRILAVIVACVALGASASQAQAPSSSSLPAEGPSERTELTSWTMRQDPANHGLVSGWQKGGFSGKSVSVPNVIDPLLYSGKVALSNYEGSIAWYRTTFNAPAAGTYSLTFESANWQATVWVDGHELGSHKGSYLPFEMRATLAAGAHTVVVRVDWQNPDAQEKLGFHRTWFNWGGIDGEVDVRPVGESELQNPSIQTTLPAGAVTTAASATVTVGVEVRNDGASGHPIVPEGTLTHGTQSIALHFPEQRLAHGQAVTVSTTVTVAEPALWSPASPNLYQLTLENGSEAGYSARVGLRQISWHGGRVYLNGARLVLHGATVQEDAQGRGDALTPADENTIVSELKAIGANAVRTQHPLYPGLLERFDAAGILTWQGIGPVEGAGNWYSTTPSLTAAAENQARTAAIAEQLHPSIFAWNLVDEMAGNGRDSAEDAYIETMSRWLHAHDPGRMVAVDVWGDHPPTHPGAVYREVDAVAETDYSGWYDHPHNSPAGVSAEISKRLAAMQRTFAGKVLVVSEFGAESNGLNPSSSPGGYRYQARLLARHIRIYSADQQLSGMFVYLLRDYPLNPTFSGGSIHEVLPHIKLIEGLDQKGLFMYDGAPKPAVSAVAALYKALPQV
jgi:beta-glucuronidase